MSTEIDRASSYNFTGEVVAITGGASGIGEEVAKEFAASGATVAILDLSKDAAESKARELGENHRAFECDVSDLGSVTAAIAAVEHELGQIDVVVNSAGVVFLDAAEDLTLDLWEKTLNVNLTGSFLVGQAAGKRMLKRGYGRIINIASQAGHVALNKHVAYTASKAGIYGLTKSLAFEWGPRGVTVNSVSPTVVLTPLGKKAWEGPQGDAHKAEIPVGRLDRKSVV